MGSTEEPKECTGSLASLADARGKEKEPTWLQKCLSFFRGGLKAEAGGAEDDQSYEARDAGRWMGLVSGMWMLACAGSSATYAIYSPALKLVGGYNQQQVDSLAVAKDMGESVGVLPGLLCDALPVWGLLLTASLHYVVGFSILWAVAAGHINPLSFPVMWLCMLVGSQGTAWFNTAVLVTSVRNFPRSRGTVVGLSKGLVGLSGAIYAQAYTALIAPDQADYLALIALLPGLVSFPAMMFLRPVHKGGHHHHHHHHLSPEELEMQEQEERSNFNFILSVYLTLSAYLLGGMLLQDAVPEVPRWVNVCLLLGMVAFLLLPLFIPFRHFLQALRLVPAPHPPLEATSGRLSASQNSEAHGSTVGQERVPSQGAIQKELLGEDTGTKGNGERSEKGEEREEVEGEEQGLLVHLGSQAEQDSEDESDESEEDDDYDMELGDEGSRQVLSRCNSYDSLFSDISYANSTADFQALLSQSSQQHHEQGDQQQQEHQDGQTLQQQQQQQARGDKLGWLRGGIRQLGERSRMLLGRRSPAAKTKVSGLRQPRLSEDLPRESAFLPAYQRQALPRGFGQSQGLAEPLLLGRRGALFGPAQLESSQFVGASSSVSGRVAPVAGAPGGSGPASSESEIVVGSPGLSGSSRSRKELLRQHQQQQQQQQQQEQEGSLKLGVFDSIGEEGTSSPGGTTDLALPAGRERVVEGADMQEALKEQQENQGHSSTGSTQESAAEKIWGRHCSADSLKGTAAGKAEAETPGASLLVSQPGRFSWPQPRGRQQQAQQEQQPHHAQLHEALLRATLKPGVRRQEANLLLAVGEGAVRVGGRRKGPRRGEDFTLAQAAVKADFWLLFFSFAIGCGSGLTAINNLAQMGLAQGYTSVRIYVSLISVCNFLGRLLAGHISEHIVKDYALPRPITLLAAQALMVLGHIMFALAFPWGSLALGSTMVGLAYGVHWSIMPATASELFGLKHFGMLYNTLTTACPMASFVFSGLIAGYLYDREAEKSGGALPPGPSHGLFSQWPGASVSPKLGLGDLLDYHDPARSMLAAGLPMSPVNPGAWSFSQVAWGPLLLAPSPPAKECYGAHCFRLTFIIMAASCSVAMLLSFILYWRTRPVYAKLYKKPVKRQIGQSHSGNQHQQQEDHATPQLQEQQQQQKQQQHQQKQQQHQQQQLSQ